LGLSGLIAKFKEVAEKGFFFALLGVALIAVIIPAVVVVVVVATVIVAVAGPIVVARAFDELVEFPSVEPYAPALRAVVDLDTLTIHHA
jgi:hypothetical protein